ncbi:MAG: HNH endonuclease [Candidatus Gracilibacteria bacterium]
MRKRCWTDQQLQLAVKNSFSFRQVLGKLGLREAGGNYAQLKKYVRDLKVDVTHFKGRGWNSGLTGIGKPRLPLEKILVKGSDFQSFKLKKRLFIAGLKSKYCEQCGWAEYTEDGYLPLELDHINGDHRDNRLENLRILCPNCHSLTFSHRGRKNRALQSARVVKWQTLNT